MKPTLIIFAKAPRLGRVKTRLARDIGPVAAWSFYRKTTLCLLRRLKGDRRWHCIMALTPDTAKAPLGMSMMGQGGGDLGARMNRALRYPPPGPVVIIGTDAPGVMSDHIHGAFKALGNRDVVFGPAEDGGFWLVGMKRRPVMAHIFNNVRWSTEHALADTLKNMPQRFRVALLETLLDVDDGASHAKWRKIKSRAMCR